MSTKAHGAVKPQDGTLLSVMLNLGVIDERPYEFVGLLDVDGATQLGTLPDGLRKVHAARMIQAKHIAKLEQQLKIEKDKLKALNGLFNAGVEETFPAELELYQDVLGHKITVDRAVFFGDGWNVYSAPTAAFKEAREEFKMEQQRARAGEDGMFGEDALGGLSLSDMLSALSLGHGHTPAFRGH